MTTKVSAPVVAVEDLRRAYQAAVAGQFRDHSLLPAGPPPSPVVWNPSADEQVVLVVGATRGAGTSVVGLALATCAGESRVVECCTVTSSSLAAASTAEMGHTGDGWVRGTRGKVIIERRGDRVPTLEAMPVPAQPSRPLTVLDCSTDIDVLLSSGGWLGAVARTLPVVAVVSLPTIPGLRRLEVAIDLVGRDRAHAILIGPSRWPKQLEQYLGPHSRALRADGRLTTFPHDPRVAFNGASAEPLPDSLVTGIAPLLSSLRGTTQ
ncbi:MAG TPA: hypothetical protein VGK53_08880 [Propionicimonas sp.]|jgi:hypothetical protein